MRKSLFVLTLAVLIIAISSAALADDVVKIGIFEPITGAMAVGGALCMQGYELAQEQKPTVLGKKVELILVDNKSDKVESASAVSRLIEKEGVVAVLGSYGSSCSIPGGEVADKAGIPMLSASVTNPLLTEGKKYIFRCCFID
ncbi:MAG: ABC transporter substrate-binding protein, partial [Candidatus Atribacteria bacterium]|nr:ABC transporter substrate-binding protein [Candidatus Atribacteria bacterium]